MNKLNNAHLKMLINNKLIIWILKEKKSVILYLEKTITLNHHKNHNSSMSEELKLYQQLVNEKAKAKSPDILPNAGHQHAAIAMSKLFDNTEHIAKMVLGSFSGKISDQANYIHSLEKCIDKNVSFEIIFLETPNENSLAYQLLKQKKGNGHNIVFKNASADFKSFLTRDGKPKHFAVFDDDKFRFEKDTEEYLALFSFNDKDNSKYLSTIFDQEFKKN